MKFSATVKGTFAFDTNAQEVRNDPGVFKFALQSLFDCVIKAVVPEYGQPVPEPIPVQEPVQVVSAHKVEQEAAPSAPSAPVAQTQEAKPNTSPAPAVVPQKPVQEPKKEEHNTQSAPITTPTTQTQPAQPAAAPSLTPAPSVQKAPETPTGATDHKALSTRLKELYRDSTPVQKKALAELLKKYGWKKVSDVPDDRLAAIVKEAEKL